MPSLTSKRSLYRYEIMQALAVVPNSATDLSTTDSIIYQIVIANMTSGAITITITDKNTTPLDLMKAVSIAAFTTPVVAFPEGVLMKGGINWVASGASSLNGQIFGLKI